MSARQAEHTAPDQILDVVDIRADLEADVARLRDQIGVSQYDLSDLIADPAAGGGADEADLGAGAFAADYETTIAVNAQRSLRQIEHALDRIRAGTYGTCETCHDRIDPARLRARPRATLCLTCQKAHRP